MQLVCRMHAEGPDSDAVQKHGAKRADFMWVGQDGMRVCGTNGSQLWDTVRPFHQIMYELQCFRFQVFIAQALVETGFADIEENKESLLRVLHWLDDGQMSENPLHFETAYRQASKGAWGFSTKEQGTNSKLYMTEKCLNEITRVYIDRLHGGSSKGRSLSAKPMEVSILFAPFITLNVNHSSETHQSRYPMHAYLIP